MLIHTEAVKWQKAAPTANLTGGSYGALAPTNVAPTGDGVIDLVTDGGINAPVANNLMLAFFGAGADNSTFSVRLTGWSLFLGTWVPSALCEFDVILCGRTGGAGLDLSATDRLADQIALNAQYSALAGVSVSVVNPANDAIAHAIVDAKGCRKVQIQALLGTATGANALYRGV